MSETLRILLAIGIVVYFVIIIHMLKKKLLLLKYSLLWLVTGIVLFVIVLWPHVLYVVAGLMGVELPVNGLFLLLFVFVITILLSLTVIISKYSNRVRTLSQKFALLEHRIRELEGREKEYESRDNNISRNK